MRAELRAAQVSPGAVLEVEGRTHVVVGTIRFTSRGRHWGEHCIEGLRPGTMEWVSIRPRDLPVAVHWTARWDLVAEPDLEGLTLDGRRWTLEESGVADYLADGHTGTGTQGTCRFVEFTDADARLVFESFDAGLWEISVGREIALDRVRAFRDVAG